MNRFNQLTGVAEHGLNAQQANQELSSAVRTQAMLDQYKEEQDQVKRDQEMAAIAQQKAVNAYMTQPRGGLRSKRMRSKKLKRKKSKRRSKY